MQFSKSFLKDEFKALIYGESSKYKLTDDDILIKKNTILPLYLIYSILKYSKIDSK